MPLRAMLSVGFVEELLETVSVPDALPTTVGLNVSVTFMDCPGLSVFGKVTDVPENPVPVTPMELIVTDPVPVEVNVTVCVVVLFTTIPPNEMLLAFAVNTGVAAFS